MNWKQKTIVRILCLIAGMLAEDPELHKELQHLSNHITQHKDEIEGLVAIERTH